MQKAKKEKRLMVIRAIFSRQTAPDIYTVRSVLGVLRVLPCAPRLGGVSFMGRAPFHCPPAPPTISQRHWGDVVCWCHLLAPCGVLRQLSGIRKLPITSQKMLVHTQVSPISSLPSCSGSGSSRLWQPLQLVTAASPTALRSLWITVLTPKAVGPESSLLLSQPQSSPEHLELTCRCPSVMEGICCASLPSSSLKREKTRADKPL